MGPNFAQISQLAMQLLSRNPRLANNPQAQYMLQVIQSGDSVEGQKIAENILQSYGMTKEQGMQQAMQMFGLGGPPRR